MKGSLCQVNQQSLRWSVASFSANHNHNHNHPLVQRRSLMPCKLKVSHSRPSQARCLVKGRKEKGLVVGCASWGLEVELEGELEAEMKQREEMGRFKHKCGERKGVVELLECLEREAIMGEDVGKEPVDYNRRAQIFDRSSRVFQALRKLNSDVPSQQSSK